MSKIRLAIIGLSSNSASSWASSAHLPYLLSTRGRERYTIHGLLNSTKESGQNAIKHYKLDKSTKAYSDPEDLAADKDVDLVVCVTHAAKHYLTVKPALEAGKNVFVEWPLAENTTKALELAEIAKKTGARTLLGLQQRANPAIVKLKEVVQSGEIGKVLSVDAKVYIPMLWRDSASEWLAPFFDKKAGTNAVTIHFSHIIDYIHSAIGEYASFNARSQIQRSTITLKSPDGSTRTVRSDVPDLVSAQGALVYTPFTADNASFNVSLQTGPPFPGNPALAITVNGEFGEIRLSSEGGALLGLLPDEKGIKLQVHEFKSDNTRNVTWEWENWRKGLGRAKDTAKLYDLYAEGKEREAGVADFAAAATRHKQIDKWLE